MASRVHNPTPILTASQVLNPTQRPMAARPIKPSQTPTAVLAAKTNLTQIARQKAKTTQNQTTSLMRMTSPKKAAVCCVTYFRTFWHATKWVSLKRECLTL